MKDHLESSIFGDHDEIVEHEDELGHESAVVTAQQVTAQQVTLRVKRMLVGVPLRA